MLLAMLGSRSLVLALDTYAIIEDDYLAAIKGGIKQ